MLLDKVIRSDVIGIDGCQRRRWRTTEPAPHRAFDLEARFHDCILRSIVALPDRPFTEADRIRFADRVGNSVQDLRLSLKGDRFGEAIQSHAISELRDARLWLTDNLAPH